MKVNDPFPEISVTDEKLDARKYIERGTGRIVFSVFFVAILGTLVAIIFSYGVLLVALLLYPLVSWYTHKKAKALIHGSGVRVSNRQFPQIHRCLLECKDRLDLKKDVDVYIVEAKVLDAATVRNCNEITFTIYVFLVGLCNSIHHETSRA
ncbi:hypothetical protein FJY63_09550 [Candidatus Sumerlaeota bacterium]|nr:hypothetical protein [Candidatus Sumerlaeota bacterium]